MKIEKNDLLLQRTGTIGKTAIALQKDIPGSANQNLAQVKIDSTKINPKMNLLIVVYLFVKIVKEQLLLPKSRNNKKTVINMNIFIITAEKLRIKNCNQKAFSIRDEKLEKEVLKIIDKITITKNVCDVALAEMERDTKKDDKEKEQILNQYQNSLKREQAKIENLIDMRAENEITKEQYANKKTKIEDNINHYEDLINKLTNGDKEFKNNFIKAFEFATDLKEKFKNGDENKKKDIILNLDSNPSIYDRKLHFCLDLRLQPFEQYAKGAVEEIRHIQTSKSSEDYRKTTPCEVAYPLWWAKESVVRTFYYSIDKLIKSLKVACLA